jgi:hypothetical protein
VGARQYANHNTVATELAARKSKSALRANVTRPQQAHFD